MRILVLGAGGTGGYFGARVAAAGGDVTFLVRPARAEQLARSGLVVKSPLGNLSLPVRAITTASEPFDLILLACKAYDLDSAIDAIAPAVGPASFIVPLLNGVQHLDVLDRRFGAGRVLGGSCYIGVTMNAAGEIEHLNKLHKLTLGARSSEQAAGAQRAYEALLPGGFALVLSELIEQELWEKYVFLATYAALTCLMRAHIGAVARTPEGPAIARELLSECVAIATAAGHRPRDFVIADTEKSVTDAASTGTASMLRDLQQGRRTEHEHILGDLWRRGRDARVAAPILRLALTQLQAYENMRHEQSAART